MASPRCRFSTNPSTCCPRNSFCFGRCGMVSVSFPRSQASAMWSAKVVCTKEPVRVAPGCLGQGTGFPAQKSFARSRRTSTSVGMSGILADEALFLCPLHFLEHPHEVRAEHFLDVVVA